MSDYPVGMLTVPWTATVRTHNKPPGVFLVVGVSIEIVFGGLHTKNVSNSDFRHRAMLDRFQ